jgi:hypothetical protein
MKAYSIVQQVNRQPGSRVDFLTGCGCLVHINGATKSVLRRENCCDPSPCGDEAVEIAPPISVDPRLIGHQPDSAIVDQIQAVGQQDFDSRTNSWWRRGGTAIVSGCGPRTGRATVPPPTKTY